MLSLVVAAAVFAIGAFVVPAGALAPPAGAFLVFAVLLILESAAFGVGIAYVVRERRALLGAGTSALQRGVAIAIAYLLLAPWPHDTLHRLSLENGLGGMNWFFLAGIEYVFHLGIVPVGFLLIAYASRGRRVVDGARSSSPRSDITETDPHGTHTLAR